MTRYPILAGMVIGAAILADASVASAQRWGRYAAPRAGVCFYENINYQGRNWCSPADSTTASVPSGMNDKVSSIRLFGNTTVTLFRDPNFRGDARVINSDVSDLRGMGFNDRVSSYQVETGRSVRTARDRVQPNVVYPNSSRWTYAGAESVVRRSYRSVLGREPDASGLRNWTQQVMNNNWTQRDLENALRQSDEYRALRNENRRPSRRR